MLTGDIIPINHSRVTHQLVVFQQVHAQTKGEEEFVLLEEGPAHVDVKRVCKIVLQNLQSKYKESFNRIFFFKKIMCPLNSITKSTQHLIHVSCITVP